MGRRKDRARTPGLWIATNELPPTDGHPFYQRLNHVLDAHAFDEFVEAQCVPLRTYIAEPERGRRTWKKNEAGFRAGQADSTAQR